jgi:hypothetical protein
MAGGNKYLAINHSVLLSLAYSGHSAMHEVLARVVYRVLSDAYLYHTGGGRVKKGLKDDKT